jgi:hypothetical protein
MQCRRSRTQVLFFDSCSSCAPPSFSPFVGFCDSFRLLLLLRMPQLPHAEKHFWFKSLFLIVLSWLRRFPLPLNVGGPS